ncbi:hypothetical protein H4R19_006035 [Coemansia spiralis]|nr:hypothetical protein H4R19_006035 [Coemansia spiralis]
MMCAISAAPLVCLRLNLIGAAFPWHQFSDNPDYPDHINFARLEQLYVTGTRCLRVDCQQEQAAHPSTLSRPACTIYFPRLQRLSLQQCRTHCSLLEYGVFPQHIPHVSFEGTPGAFALLASSTIGSIGYLELGLCCDQHEPFAGFDMVVSHLCGMAGRSYNVCYVMSPAVLQMDLLQADFYAVTKLELTRLPRIQPLLELASMMPRLNTLVVNCINGEFLRTDPVLAEIIDGTYPLTGFPPITVTVCTLFLNVVRQDYNYVRSLVNCLATCARSLRRMSVDGIPLANPRRNIDEVAHLCPVSK